MTNPRFDSPAFAAAGGITFSGASGERLAARLDRPAGERRATALFAHCFTCSKDIAAATRVSLALARRGFAVLRFDFTGLGHSGGEFSNTNFSSNVEDLLAAADWLRRELEAPSLLVGHSFGGAAVLAAAPRVPEATAVATIAAPADPAHVAHLFAEQRDKIEKTGRATVRLAGREFTIRRQFLDDIEGQSLTGRLAELDKALLIFHSPRDRTVSIDNAARIFAAAAHPKSFVSLEDADHLLSHREDAEYVAEVLAAWASRYLRERRDDGDGGPVSSGAVRARESREGRRHTLIRAGHHRLESDAPRPIGDDRGPSPYDLLLAALGADAVMALRRRAERAGRSGGRITIRLEQDHEHERDNDRGDALETIRRRARIESGRDDKEDKEDNDAVGESFVAAVREALDDTPLMRSLRRGLRFETEVEPARPEDD